MKSLANNGIAVPLWKDYRDTKSCGTEETLKRITYDPIGTIHTPFKDTKDMPTQAKGGRGIKGTIKNEPGFCGRAERHRGIFPHHIDLPLPSLKGLLESAV